MTHGLGGGARDHSLDAARSLLMILGVPYHAALIYTPGYDWVMNSPDGIVWIGLFADLIHSFRMPAFFLISGLLIAHSLRRHGPRAVLTSRASRLLVPLFAMAATLNVAQLWMETRAVDPGLTAAEFFARTVPAAFHSGGLVYHLWFLVELSVGVLALCLAYPLLAALHRRMAERAPGLARWLADPPDWLPPLLLSLVMIGVLGFDNLSPLLLAPLVPTNSTAVSIVTSAGFFTVGVLIAHWPGGAARYAKASWGVALTFLLCFAIHIGMVGVEKPMPVRFLDEALRAVAAWSAFRFVLGLMQAYFSAESRRVRALSQASYTIYLLHHLVVMALGFALLAVPAPPLLEFAGITAVGLVLPLAVHHGLVRRSPTLRFLLNGVPPGRKKERTGPARDREAMARRPG
ncbi:acyltransferase family protein [Azospirillum isscasi]|uniref:Acyltransferase family protein n=1 Tax=Azospirillum isscasi TaxID=3053926 RepID=A0ABU0WBB3_9PROT|nr:acyltransferase family protein [Azospirillum isscasi]MDQ2101478.1 acyltransferase family protein [Azospirillum isscasi]